MTIECRGNDANEKVQLVLEFLFNECTASLLVSKNKMCTPVQIFISLLLVLVVITSYFSLLYDINIYLQDVYNKL